MANQTKTLKAQTLNLFGPTPTQRWGAFSWGSPNTWGMKSNTTSSLPQLFIQIAKVWSGAGNSVAITAPASALSRGANKVWTGTNKIAWAYANTDREQRDGSGYFYVFVDRTTNAESAATNAYASISAGSASWSLVSVSATTWS